MADTVSRERILRLSDNQRKMLVAHIDKTLAVPGWAELVRYDRHESKTRTMLLKAKLIRGLPQYSTRPTHTTLTESGREAVCVILGDCADMLVQAGLMEREDRPWMLQCG